MTETDWSASRLVLLPPCIIKKSDDPRTSSAKGFLVHMSKNADEATYRHEMLHVWQFWVKMAAGLSVMALLLHLMFLPKVSEWLIATLTQTGFDVLQIAVIVICPAAPHFLTERIREWDWSEEAAAYARSVRYGRKIESCAAALASNHVNYQYGKSYEACLEKIKSKLDKRWYGGYALF